MLENCSSSGEVIVMLRDKQESYYHHIIANWRCCFAAASIFINYRVFAGSWGLTRDTYMCACDRLCRMLAILSDMLLVI